MRSPKSLYNLQHDGGGNYMAETEAETETVDRGFEPRSGQIKCYKIGI
jgi:hypothetical protein